MKTPAVVLKFAVPDGTIQVIKGVDWARINPLLCPQCGQQFYGWCPIDKANPKAIVDKNAPGDMSARQTCGHPDCWHYEDEHQFRRRLQDVGTHKEA